MNNARTRQQCERCSERSARQTRASHQRHDRVGCSEAAKQHRLLSAGELDVEAPPAGATAVRIAEMIDDGEIIILQLRPSPVYIVLAPIIQLGLIALLTFALAYLARLHWTGWSDSQAFILGVGLAALRIGWQAVDWFNHSYLLTDRRVITRSGIVKKSIFAAPLNEIHHTSICQSFAERVCGLGTIGFFTAERSGVDCWWHMLRNPHEVHRIINDAIKRYGRK